MSTWEVCLQILPFKRDLNFYLIICDYLAESEPEIKLEESGSSKLAVRLSYNEILSTINYNVILEDITPHILLILVKEIISQLFISFG